MGGLAARFLALVVFLALIRDDGAVEGKDLLKTGDVARLLGVSRQHVVDTCDRGEIAFVRVGAQRRIARSEVSRLMGALSREQERVYCGCTRRS